MRSYRIATLSLAIVFTACTGIPIKKAMTASTNADSAPLGAIISEYTEAAKHQDAFAAPYFDVEENLGKFGDYPTPAYFARAKAIYVKALSDLRSIPFSSLSPRDQRTYRIFKQDMEVSLEGFKFPQELLDFNQMGNRLHSYLDDSSESLTSFPFDSVKHYEDFISRSEGFPSYVDHQIQLLQRGLREGVVLNCFAATNTPNSYKDGLEPIIEKNPFYRPILFMPKNFPDSDRRQLEIKFRKMISERILPGFQKFDSFFKGKYAPHCRSEYGIGSIPNGKNWYAYSILRNTNLALSPKAIHEKGLAEVRRIATELKAVKNKIGFQGSLKNFRRSLLNNPDYFFKDRKTMFEAFAKVKEDVSKKMPEYFNLVPKHDYKIVETSNPEDAAGSYNEPTDNIPFGRFIVNTKNLRSVPVYEVTTLSLHETIPGHHFQQALQFEMKDRLSEYERKLFFSNSFVEGWALYSEYLGNEMGMYADPVQRLGHLNDEMLRAARLVVDTGIHSYGWSREKAISYMKANLATDEKNISNEANRYAVWPGQALGYKIGELKIIELRKLAEKELGPRFDIKEFHRVVIGNGTVSLSILESQVKDWITEIKAVTTRQ